MRFVNGGDNDPDVLHPAPHVLQVPAMSNPFVSIDPSELHKIQGGRGLVEGGRKLLQAGAVAWNTLFPTNAPIKPPPTPQRIERVAPNPQGQSRGGSRGGQE